MQTPTTPHNATPPFSAVEPAKGRGWLKRVGISRDPAYTLRSKKEGQLHQSKAVTFPDKVGYLRIFFSPSKSLSILKDGG